MSTYYPFPLIVVIVFPHLAEINFILAREYIRDFSVKRENTFLRGSSLAGAVPASACLSNSDILLGSPSLAEAIATCSVWGSRVVEKKLSNMYPGHWESAHCPCLV